MSAEPTIAIVPQGQGFVVSIPIEAVRLKSEALTAAKEIVQVTSPEEQRAAIAAVARLKRLSAGVEAAREQVKAPYWNAGKAIDAKAKEYAKELDDTAKAIEGMIGEFQRAERAKAETARLEQERIRKESEAAVAREQQRVAEAERARIAAEKAAADAEAARAQAEIDAAEAKTAAARKKAQAELAKQTAAAEEAARAQRGAEEAKMMAEIDASEAEENANDASAIVYTPEAPKAIGASIKDVIEFDITDTDAFAAWDLQRRSKIPNTGGFRIATGVRSFIRIEVRKQDFKDFINILPPAALDEIPGVKFTRSTKAAVRAEQSSISLE